MNDTRLSDAPCGSAEFFAALDAYRLRKCEYLPRVVDFGGWTGRDVLEIGCGAGLDLVRFARGGARVTGVDVVPAAIALTRDYCRVAGVPAVLVEADGARLPFPDAAFDLVYCHGVLSFVRDPGAVIAEAHRVLRPGGEAILMVYNRRSWMHLLLKVFGGLIGQGHADAPAFRTYSLAEFERLVAVFTEKRFVTERHLPAGAGFMLRALPEHWLRPYGWHLLAFCRKSA